MDSKEIVDSLYAADLLAWSRTLPEHRLPFDEWRDGERYEASELELAIAA
jgi:hypothetical protein